MNTLYLPLLLPKSVLDEGELVCSLRCLSYFVSAYTFWGVIVLVCVPRKEILLPHTPFYYICIYMTFFLF